MGPIVEQAKKDYTGKSVEFVTFDFTSDETVAAADAAAAKHSVDKVYADHKKKTGFLLLVDSASGDIIGKLSAKDDMTAWKAAIDKALGAG